SQPNGYGDPSVGLICPLNTSPSAMAIILAYFPTRGVSTPVGIPSGNGRSANTDLNFPSNKAATVFGSVLNDAGSGALVAICNDKCTGTGNTREKGDVENNTVLSMAGTARVSNVPANSLRTPSIFLTIGWLSLGIKTG